MLLNGLMKLINFIILCLGSILNFILDLLPTSPIKLLDNTPIAAYLKYINFFIPIGLMIDCLYLFLAAWAVYHVYQIAMRWIKIIGS